MITFGITFAQPDCCEKVKYGERLFKGEQTFNSTLVFTTAESNCFYNPSAVSYRRCLGNMKDGPYWEEKVDLAACTAKSEATNQLLKLNKVKNAHF